VRVGEEIERKAIRLIDEVINDASNSRLARDTSSNASVTKAGQLSSYRVGERMRVAVRDTRLQVRLRASPMRAAGDRNNHELHFDR